MRGRIALKSCSEEKQWLMSIGIPGIERLADEFESRGFSTRKSLQYLQDGDLHYIFASPKRLLLAEKQALHYELRHVKLKSQEPGSTVHLMPKQLQFSSTELQSWPAEGETATASNPSSTAARKSLLKMSVFWRHRYQVQRTIWQSLKAKMICSRPFPAEEFAVTVISLAITGTIAAELHVTLTLNVN